MTTNANTALGAYVNKKAQDEFDRLVASPLMHKAARHYINAGETSDELGPNINSGAFYSEWVNNGGDAPSMIGLPAAALITVMRNIEEAGA